MSRLVLVRHAATAWTGVRLCGRTDLPLSDDGRLHATALARRLAEADLSVATVRSSPAARARGTAEEIAAALGAQVMSDARLREADFGSAEGRTFAELERRWPDLARSLLAGKGAIDWPGGERAAELVARLEPLVGEFSSGEAADAMVVSHGGPIRVLAALLGLGCGRPAILGPAELLVLERGARWRPADLPELGAKGRGGEVT